MSGYTKEEALGHPHSLLRHPDMPKAAFAEMWKIVQSGKMWEGYVKNLRKDGRFYWVIVNIIPKYDENHIIVGYTASRKIPNRDMINKVSLQYKEMIEKE
jgi:aerotaxis receptor